MREAGVTNIRFDSEKNQLVVEFNNRSSSALNNNDLTSEQRELKNFFQNSSSKTDISRSELEQAVADFKDLPGGNKDGDGNVGIIAFVVIVGLILAVIIGFMIGQKKKKK